MSHNKKQIKDFITDSKDFLDMHGFKPFKETKERIEYFLDLNKEKITFTLHTELSEHKNVLSLFGRCSISIPGLTNPHSGKYNLHTNDQDSLNVAIFVNKHITEIINSVKRLKQDEYSN